MKTKKGDNMIGFKVGPKPNWRLYCVLCGQNFGEPDYEVVILEDWRVWGPVCFDCLKAEPEELSERMIRCIALSQAGKIHKWLGPAERIQLEKWSEQELFMPPAEAIERARRRMEKSGKPEDVK